MAKLTYCPICNEITYHDRDKIYHCPTCNHHLNTIDLKGDYIMSNEYKEWEEDRKIEAYEDIIVIAEIIENWRKKGSDSGYMCDSFFNIIDILDKGGWI